MGNERIVAGCHFCWHLCEVCLDVKDGLLQGATANPEAVFSKGYICERLEAAKEFHYSHRRLNYPQKRVGARGGGKWEQISWDEALDEIADRMLEIREEFGPEAVAKIGGTIHGPADWSAWRFFNLWGSPNVINLGKNCGQANTSIECAMYGWDSLGMDSGILESKNIVLWGSNLPESNPLKWRAVLTCRLKGARVIVIDPRYSEAASYADLWLRPRPGTDGALGWGVIHVLIEEELYDKRFVEDWCSGFDELAKKAQRYTPEIVSSITDVPAALVRTFARWYADGPTNYVWSLSQCHFGDGAGYAAAYTQSVIRAITGNLDRKGGNVLTGPIPREIDWYGTLAWDRLEEHLRVSDRDSLSAADFPICSKESLFRYTKSIKSAWGQGYGCPLYFVYPTSRSVYDAILTGEPYPIKALFVQGGNPLVTLAGAKRCHKAMQKVDLLVGMDFFMTPSMAMCDFVLPAASWIERPHLMTFWGVTPVSIGYRQPMQPLYERRDDYSLWAELARRVGLEGEWPKTLEGMLDIMLRPSGMTFREFSESPGTFFANDTGKAFERYKHNGYGFGTPSGKCELAPSILAAAGLDPVPDYAEPPQSASRTPDLFRKYPLTLVSGSRCRPYWHASYRELKSIRWRHELPETHIHPETARTYGIVNGETVCIETPYGAIRQKACVSTTVPPGVVHAEAFWYYPERAAREPQLCGVWDSNINAIIPDDHELCDFAGDLPFRGLLCRIYKADDPLDYTLPDYVNML